MSGDHDEFMSADEAQDILREAAAKQGGSGVATSDALGAPNKPLETSQSGQSLTERQEHGLPPEAARDLRSHVVNAAVQAERELLHGVLEEAYAVIDPERHAHVSARIHAVLSVCNGGCTWSHALRTSVDARFTPTDKGKANGSAPDPSSPDESTLPVSLAVEIQQLRKHLCSSCDLTDEEWTRRDGWNAALNAVDFLVRRHGLQEGPRTDDLARSPSVGCASAPGSPRSSQPNGSQR